LLVAKLDVEKVDLGNAVLPRRAAYTNSVWRCNYILPVIPDFIHTFCAQGKDLISSFDLPKMGPPTTADLIFSEQANHNFSKTLGDLKRHTLSINNRLQSIVEDASFVQKVKAAWQRPLIANERCGSWYIDPATKNGSAYFKSTDGHTGVWKFSTRRLNLHLLPDIGKHDG
jgi:hypothetical protein